MIIYTLISKGSLILLEFTEQDGDFPQLAKKVLMGLKKPDQKQMFTKDEYVFCVLTSKDYRYLCMIHNTASKEKAFLFLEALQQDYMRDSQDPNYSNAKFAAKMANYMKGFNRLDQKDALMDLENTVDDLHESAAANLRSMIEREVKLEVLVEKTNELRQNSDLMYHHSRRVRKHVSQGNFRIGCKLLLFGVNLLAAVSVYIYLAVF